MSKHVNVQSLVEQINSGELTEEALNEMIQSTMDYAVEHALRSLPGAIDHIMKQTMVIKKAADQFYEKNKELVPHKQMVAQIVEQAEAENPGLSYDQVLRRAEQLAKRRLKDKQVIVNQPKGKLSLEDLDNNLGDL